MDEEEGTKVLWGRGLARWPCYCEMRIEESRRRVLIKVIQLLMWGFCSCLFISKDVFNFGQHTRDLSSAERVRAAGVSHVKGLHTVK